MIHSAFPSWYATVTARRSVAINTLSAWHICTCRTLCVPFMFWDRWTQQSCVSKARPESFTHDLYEGSRVTGLMYHRSLCHFISVKLWVFFHSRPERGVEGDGRGISQPLQNDFMRFVLSPRLTTWIELCPKHSIPKWKNSLHWKQPRFRVNWT